VRKEKGDLSPFFNYDKNISIIFSIFKEIISYVLPYPKNRLADTWDNNIACGGLFFSRNRFTATERKGNTGYL
jgi:hypothetical protein